MSIIRLCAVLLGCVFLCACTGFSQGSPAEYAVPVDGGPVIQTKAAKPKVIYYSGGGSTLAFAREVERLQRFGIPVKFEGDVYSAGTFFLAAPGTCVPRDRMFGFHSSTPHWLGKAPTFKAAKDELNQIAASFYNPKLRAWFFKNCTNRHLGFCMLSGEQLIEQFGYTPCDR